MQGTALAHQLKTRAIKLKVTELKHGSRHRIKYHTWGNGNLSQRCTTEMRDLEGFALLPALHLFATDPPLPFGYLEISVGDLVDSNESRYLREIGLC